MSETKAKVTREQFVQQWCGFGRYDPSRLPRDKGVISCECGEPHCEGWKIVAATEPIQEGYVSVRRLALTDGNRYGEELLQYWEWTAQDSGLEGGKALSRACELLRQETEPHR